MNKEHSNFTFEIGTQEEGGKQYSVGSYFHNSNTFAVWREDIRILTAEKFKRSMYGQRCVLCEELSPDQDLFQQVTIVTFDNAACKLYENSVTLCEECGLKHLSVDDFGDGTSQKKEVHAEDGDKYGLIRNRQWSESDFTDLMATRVLHYTETTLESVPRRYTHFEGECFNSRFALAYVSYQSSKSMRFVPVSALQPGKLTENALFVLSFCGGIDGADQAPNIKYVWRPDLFDVVLYEEIVRKAMVAKLATPFTLDCRYYRTKTIHHLDELPGLGKRCYLDESSDSDEDEPVAKRK